MSIQRVCQFLTEKGVPHSLNNHALAYTSQEVAHSAHIPGRYMAKTVIVWINNDLALAVVPASKELDLDALRAKPALPMFDWHRKPNSPVSLRPASPEPYPRSEISSACEPSSTSAWRIQDFLVFNAGTHTDVVCMRFSDYARLVKPLMVHIAVPPKSDRAGAAHLRADPLHWLRWLRPRQAPAVDKPAKSTATTPPSPFRSAAPPSITSPPTSENIAPDLRTKRRLPISHRKTLFSFQFRVVLPPVGVPGRPHRQVICKQIPLRKFAGDTAIFRPNENSRVSKRSEMTLNRRTRVEIRRPKSRRYGRLHPMCFPRHLLAEPTRRRRPRPRGMGRRRNQCAPPAAGNGILQRHLRGNAAAGALGRSHRISPPRVLRIAPRRTGPPHSHHDGLKDTDARTSCQLVANNLLFAPSERHP